jgi:hypothetical protein
MWWNGLAYGFKVGNGHKLVSELFGKDKIVWVALLNRWFDSRGCHKLVSDPWF